MTKPIKLITVDGEDLNNAAFTTDFQRGQVLIQVGARKATTVESVGDFPEYVGSTQGERRAIVMHTIRGNPGGAQWRANLDALKRHYHHDKGVRTVVQSRGGVLVEAQYVFEELAPGDAPQLTAIGTWLLQSSIQHAVEAVEETESGTTATLAVSVTNPGNVPSRRVTYEIMATAARSGADGHTKGYPVTLVNRSRRQVPRWGIDLADDVAGSTVGSYPHDADVTAGDSLASGADLEVWNVRTGERLNRWFGAATLGGVNEATTAVWIAEALDPGRYWTALGAFDDNDTQIKLKEPLVNLPAPRWCLVNTTTGEVMRVTAASGRFVTVARGCRGTAAAAISSGEKLWVASMELWIIIGRDDANTVDTPVYDDDFKPIHLTSPTERSSNHYKSYARFLETRTAKNLVDVVPRADAWRMGLRDQDAERCDPNRERRTAKGDMYTRYIGRTAAVSTDATPATALVLEYSHDGAQGDHPLISRWELESPIGITQLVFSLDNNEFEFPDASTPTASPTQRVEMRAEDDSGNDVLAASYANVGSPGTKTIDFDPPVYLTALAVHPFDPKVDGADTGQTANEPEGPHGSGSLDYAKFSAIKVTFKDSEEILPVWGAKQSIYQLGRPDDPLTLTNADGNGLAFYGLIAPLDVAVVVDVDEGIIRLDTDDAPYQAAFVKLVGKWPEVPPGASSITLTDPLTPGTWEITVSFRPAYN